MANEKISQLPLISNADIGANSIFPITNSADSVTYGYELSQQDLRYILNSLTTLGDTLYGGASGVSTRLAGNTTSVQKFLAQTGTGSASNAPSWVSPTMPTTQTFLSTGTTTGYVFTVSSANATVGATYTNNSNTYTVLGTIAAGTQLFCSGASAPTSSGTLTKASGTGDATISFSAESALATYTPTSSAVKYIKIIAVGPGGGGSGGGVVSSFGAGGNGGNTLFGANLIACGGGSGGPNGTSGTGGAGGTITVGSGPSSLIKMNGSAGNPGSYDPAGTLVTFPAGGLGGMTPLGGAGAPGLNTTNINPAANSGCGGPGGASTGAVNSFGGYGGGAGAYYSGFLPVSLASYPYQIGSAGAAGTAGTTGNAGSPGATGQLIIEEHYI